MEESVLVHQLLQRQGGGQRSGGGVTFNLKLNVETSESSLEMTDRSKLLLSVESMQLFQNKSSVKF